MEENKQGVGANKANVRSTYQSSKEIGIFLISENQFMLMRLYISFTLFAFSIWAKRSAEIEKKKTYIFIASKTKITFLFAFKQISLLQPS